MVARNQGISRFSLWIALCRRSPAMGSSSTSTPAKAASNPNPEKKLKWILTHSAMSRGNSQSGARLV